MSVIGYINSYPSYFGDDLATASLVLNRDATATHAKLWPVADGE